MEDEDISFIPLKKSGRLYLGGFWEYIRPVKIRTYNYWGEQVIRLKKLDISTIVSIGNSSFTNCEFTCYVYRIDDGDKEEMRLHLEKIADLIEQTLTTRKNIYLHCMAGRSRSPTVLAYYLMKYQDMKATEAIEYIKKYREIEINPQFLDLLKSL